MVPDDLFITRDVPFGPGSRLNTGLLERMRASPLDDTPDIEAVFALVGLLRAEYMQFGTEGGEQLSDNEVVQLQRTARVVAQRLGVDLEVPWRNFSGFKGYWLNNDGYGSWQARRDMVAEVFDPVQDRLEQLEDGLLVDDVAQAVTSHDELGWVTVDAEIGQIRRAFRRARSPREHREVGLACVALLEALSEVVYDPERHLYDGEEVPPVAKTKMRLARVVEHELADQGTSKELARLVKCAIELSEAVKHSPNRSRTEAGIAADAVFLVANMLRRLTPHDAD